MFLLLPNNNQTIPNKLDILFVYHSKYFSCGGLSSLPLKIWHHFWISEPYHSYILKILLEFITILCPLSCLNLLYLTLNVQFNHLIQKFEYFHIVLQLRFWLVNDDSIKYSLLKLQEARNWFSYNLICLLILPLLIRPQFLPLFPLL